MTIYWQGDGITLHLGDCREETAWLEADVLVCDPPYGVSWTVPTKRAGRKAIGVELEERYCEIAARRLSQGVLEFPA